MSSQQESCSIDGSKFICNGVEIGYDYTKNCYQRFQTGSCAEIYNIVGNDRLESALKDSVEAFRAWKMKPCDVRINSVEMILRELVRRRADIIKVIMWDTDKCIKEATAEYEQAKTFIESAIRAYQNWYVKSQNAKDGSDCRNPVGVVLCWSPGSNSFCDTVRLAIPALLMGNSVVIKIPCSGGLVHILTIPVAQEALPPNVLQYVLGPDDELIKPIMQTGDVSMLAMVGDRRLADRLIHAHPYPHRLKLNLDLDTAILVVVTDTADVRLASREIVTRGLGRERHATCHLKLVLVHTAVAQELLHCLRDELHQNMQRDRRALSGSSAHEQPEHHQQLLIDALRKGALVVNADDGGGKLVPDLHGTVMRPALVYPVNDTMALWTEEFRGGVLPVASFDTNADAAAVVEQAESGTQLCIFAATPLDAATTLLADGASHRCGAVVVNGLHAGSLAVEGSEEELAKVFDAYTQEVSLRSYPSVSNLAALDVDCDDSDVSGAAGAGAGNQQQKEKEGGGVDKDKDMEGCLPFSSPISVTNLERLGRK